MNRKQTLFTLLARIAEALERTSPPVTPPADPDSGEAFIWRAELGGLERVEKVSRLDISLLQGIERQAHTLFENTLRFANGYPANNALLWGARGTGKSSLVKSVHAAINETADDPIVLVEIQREDIHSLPRLLSVLRGSSRRFLLFCDDLSFDADDSSYKSLKAILDGGIEGRPENVLFYATSNRRHLLARDMIENERSTAIHAGEAVEEKVSLSDRFGLWLGFHNIDQDTYLRIIDGYMDAFDIEGERDELHARALEWSITRGSRSGRVAWQFIQDVAGEQGIRLPL